MAELVARILGLLAAAGLLASAAATRGQQAGAFETTELAKAVRPSKSQEAEHMPPAERNPRYRICRDDVLLLSFPLSPELNQKVIVQPDGFIALQNVGSLYVEGLTVPGVIEAVKMAYAKTLHDPIIDVDLADFQKPFFTVLGQVGKPGQYDLRRDITVTEAIAVAGGFTGAAKTQIFLYRSVSANWAEVRELKLKDILRGKNFSEDMHLRPGDMIFVPEKAITKFQRYVPYTIGSGAYPTIH
jgi:polysaccharide export outer membrane protein